MLLSIKEGLELGVLRYYVVANGSAWSQSPAQEKVKLNMFITLGK